MQTKVANFWQFLPFRNCSDFIVNICEFYICSLAYIRLPFTLSLTSNFITASVEVCVAVGIDVQVLADNIQKDIRTMEGWAKDHGLKFNAKKTKVMLFTRKNVKRRPKLYINGEEIEYVNEYKYLGVTIDSKLSWNKHIQNIANRATGTFMQCQTMLGRTWGLSPKITRWAYLSLIRPTMSYGSLIWLKGTFIPSQAKYLVKVQRRACTAILS